VSHSTPKKSQPLFCDQDIVLKIKKNQTIKKKIIKQILLWLNKNSSLQRAALYKIPMIFIGFDIVTTVLWICTERTAINIY
jgi:hypothetical protein